MKIAFFHELHAGGARRASNEFAKHLSKNHIVDLFIVDNQKTDCEKLFITLDKNLDLAKSRKRA